MLWQQQQRKQSHTLAKRHNNWQWQHDFNRSEEKADIAYNTWLINFTASAYNTWLINITASNVTSLVLHQHMTDCCYCFDVTIIVYDWSPTLLWMSLFWCHYNSISLITVAALNVTSLVLHQCMIDCCHCFDVTTIIYDWSPSLLWMLLFWCHYNSISLITVAALNVTPLELHQYMTDCCHCFDVTTIVYDWSPTIVYDWSPYCFHVSN